MTTIEARSEDNDRATRKASGPRGRPTETRERALLVGLARSARERARAESSLEELGHLVESAGAEIAGSLIQLRSRLDAATLIGSGKVADVAQLAEASRASLVVFDEDLSPAQQRNIEGAVGLKTLDRTQVILDIFARRARTREGRLQVELAQLEYLLPRLSGRGVLLSRLGGGIGTRGPGETKLETDRRRIRRRVQSVRREIEDVRRRRRTNRDGRARSALPMVALVGYTNAGKSTLFNALARADAVVSNALFVTLDPLVRRLRLAPGREALLADTVGFIRKLPHGLVAAFQATLEEVACADLLLHVVDASADDLAGRDHAVQEVLREIGAEERPCLRVLNQIDKLEPARQAALAASDQGAVLVSARTGAGLDALRLRIVDRLGLNWRSVRLHLAPHDRASLAAVYRLGRVRSHEVEEDGVHLQAEVPAWLAERLRGSIV